MRVIQSHAQYVNGSPYVRNDSLNYNEKYLNFYTFLLSFLTLKKYYGSVAMYCNLEAYNTFIKYIPYDEIIFKEPTESFDSWNYYKVEVINDQKEKFVHVDSDVFIFDDLFKPFNDGNYDGIVQDTITPKVNDYFSKHFVYENQSVLKKHGIFDISIYDGRCFSCGVIGMTMNVLEKYKNMTKKLMRIKNQLIFRYVQPTAIIEELGFYLTALNNSYKMYEVLPYEEILKNNGDPRKVGDKYKYTHMWFDTKYVKRNVELIKGKILKDFPDQYGLVEQYDEYIKNFDIKYK
jgi:hypothetical protein